MLYKSAYLIIIVALISCSSDTKKIHHSKLQTKISVKDSIIEDCNYTLKEATAGSKAPDTILQQLQLIDLKYYSTDGKIHKGQILANRKFADKIRIMFGVLFQNKFPIAHAIPIVKYNWDDNLSMEANNTYSFCYRDISYSKHALGMAIDINPFFNPVRWKIGYKNRAIAPTGAHYDISRPGTFYGLHPVVVEFKKLGLHWGHDFKHKYDDHHFEI